MDTQEIQEISERTDRYSCLRIGAYLVTRKTIEEYSLTEILGKYFSKRLTFVFDLAANSIITEDNAGQYYHSYAYNHPLFSEQMHIYSDFKASDLLQTLTEDQSVGFLNNWNETRDHWEKIYVSYDSANKYCLPGDIEIVEYGILK